MEREEKKKDRQGDGGRERTNQTETEWESESKNTARKIMCNNEHHTLICTCIDGIGILV